MRITLSDSRVVVAPSSLVSKKNSKHASLMRRCKLKLHLADPNNEVAAEPLTVLFDETQFIEQSPFCPSASAKVVIGMPRE